MQPVSQSGPTGAPPETPPRPETTRAILISAGYRKPTTTVHFYKESRLVDTNDGPQWGHFYECFKTGALRVWGVERTAVDAEMELN